MRDDLELLRAWRAGDREAGGELYNRHFESIRRFFVNKAGDDTEDLIQRTFLGCTEASARFEERSSVRAFIFGIAQNVLREFFRKKKRAAAIDPAVDSVADLGTGPGSVVARKAEHRLLLEALRNLPLDLQIVLELYFWEELTGPELSEVLGIPEATARSRIRRGKLLLKEVMGRLEARRDVVESTTANLDGWAKQLRAQVLPAGR